jgi:DNA repair photolyase
MGLLIKEIKAKSILTKSGIPGADYCINPYTGCSHGCTYCYASYMKKYTHHDEPWGSFVDVKINAPDILRKQMKRARKGSIIISSVTDPYQPIESRYRITRQCLEELLPYQFSVDILTKSSLVLRDVKLIKQFRGIEVGITITTDDEGMKEIFEPQAPSIKSRIETLKKLHSGGIRTYAFIGPLLPMNHEMLCEKIAPYTDYVFIDKMNYIPKTFFLYKNNKLDEWLNKEFLNEIIKRLKNGFKEKQVHVCCLG